MTDYTTVKTISGEKFHIWDKVSGEEDTYELKDPSFEGYIRKGINSGHYSVAIHGKYTRRDIGSFGTLYEAFDWAERQLAILEYPSKIKNPGIFLPFQVREID